MKNNINLKEVVVLAMISVLMGAVFTGLDSIYEPLTALAGPFGGAIIYGVYLISALIPMYIVRKPGAGLVGSLFTGVVNLLMGSPYGIHIIVASTLQGLGVEIPIYFGKYKRFNLLYMSICAVLAMILVTIRDYFVFGFGLYGSLMPAIFIVRTISSIVFGAGLTIAIGKALLSTGVLNGFRIAAKSGE